MATIDSGRKIFDFNTLDGKIQNLIKAAIEVRKKAHCPYSNFPVGAALQTTTGEVFTGCNVENAAFGPSMCAERVALGKAVSEGFREFTSIAVVAYQESMHTMPCGVCRQVLSEFAIKDIDIYAAKPAPLIVYKTSLFELLPHRFVPSKGDFTNLHFNT